jgi:hypothetical protein
MWADDVAIFVSGISLIYDRSIFWRPYLPDDDADGVICMTDGLRPMQYPLDNVNK